MRVEQQGHDECMLSTIAALCNVRLKRVRNIAVHWAGVSAWSETDSKPKMFWPAVKRTCERIGHPKVYDLVCVPELDPPMSDAGGDLSIDLDEFPEGRGCVIIRGGYWGSHIMPWKDGLCYDPCHPDKPYTMPSLRKTGCEIIRITYLHDR